MKWKISDAIFFQGLFGVSWCYNSCFCWFCWNPLHDSQFSIRYLISTVIYGQNIVFLAFRKHPCIPIWHWWMMFKISFRFDAGITMFSPLNIMPFSIDNSSLYPKYFLAISLTYYFLLGQPNSIYCFTWFSAGSSFVAYLYSFTFYSDIAKLFSLSINMTSSIIFNSFPAGFVMRWDLLKWSAISIYFPGFQIRLKS